MFNLSPKVFLKLSKLVFALVVTTVLFLFSNTPAKAATLYWVGVDGANGSVATNWSTTDPSSCSTGVTPSGAAPGAADTITFDGNCDNSAVIDSGFASTITAINMATGYTGTVTLSNPLTLTSTSSNAFIISSGTFNSTTQTITLNAGGGFNLAGGTYRAPSTTQSMSGPFTISSGTFDITTNPGGTINFNGGTASISCNNVTFNAVTFTGASGTKTIQSNCSLPIGSNPSVPMNLHLSGTVSGSGTLTMGAGATFTMNGTLAVLSGFSGLTGGSFVIQNNATLNASSYTTFAFPSSLSQSSGVLSLPVGTDTGLFTLSGGTLNAPAGNMTASRLIFSGTPTFNANGGTITLDGTGGNLTCANVTFNQVVLSNISGTYVVGSDCNLPLGANPTITRGPTLNGTLSGSGTLTVLGAGTQFTLNSGAVLSGFSGLNATLLTIAGASLDLSGYSSVAVSSNVNISSGSLSLPNGTDFNNGLTISGGTFNAPSGTMSLAGALTITNSPIFNANGGTFNLDGTADATLTCNSVLFNLVTFTHTDSGTKTIGTNCTIPIGNNPTATGRIRLNAATAVLSGTGTFTSTCELSSCLRITSGSFTGFNGLVMYGNLSVDGGTLDLSNYNPVTIYGRNAAQSFSVSSGGTITAPSGVMTVYDVVNIQATFNHNNGTLRYQAEPADTSIGFTAATTSVSLYNVVVDPDIIATFGVTAGSELTILGNLTMRGSDESNLLSLRSSSAGTQWSIDAQGSRSLQYLDVQDSNNTSGLTMTALCSTDSGNNSGWLFPPCGGSIFNLVSPSDRSYTRDERPTFSWRPPSDSSFFSAAREYNLIVDNGQGSDFTIEGIPAGKPNGNSIYETDKYRVEYLNWDNEDLADNLISLVTKSSNTWSTDHHDGKLTEGKRNWRVQFKDSSNTIYEMSNELFVDFTPPATTLSKINILDYVPAVLTSDTTPTIFGQVTDPLRGTPEDRKVAAGPKSIEIMIEKKIMGGYSTQPTDTISIAKNYWQADGSVINDNTKNTSDKYSPFEYTFSKPLASGTYKITLTPRDNIDNAFTSQIFQIRVAGYDEVQSSLTSDQQQTYQAQVSEKSDLTIPDPNEDQEKLATDFNKQVQEMKNEDESFSNKSTNNSGFILGASAAVLIPTFWFFLIWKRKKKKQKGGHA